MSERASTPTEAATPIEGYALIGDLHTAALVATNGSIDWLCLPHFDSAACFASLLHTPDAGRWLLAPASGGHCTSRQYRPDGLILETEWRTEQGHVRITDFMPVRDSAANVVRIVEGLSGSVDVHGDLAIRFDYGHVVPWVRRADAWREWLLRAAAGDPADLQIMYGLDGRRRLPETTLDWLRGYEGSSPVRVGQRCRRPAPARRLGGGS